ncbi:MAG: hypothetical protein Q4C77_17730 [Eubacteriales bacterium]|nr:hypothetical protein [Eubacteriales bacterium]
MKSIKKRITSLAVALILAMTIIPAAAVEAAVTAPKSITVYHSDKSTSSSFSFAVSGLSAKQYVAKSSIKSSNKSVAAPSYLDHYSNAYKTEYFNGLKPYSGSSKEASLSFTSKKSGTSTISYKIGSKTYKTKVTVKKYVNPVKSISLFGIKNGKTTNLAGLLKSANNASIKLNATKKKQTIRATAASGWKIRSFSLYDYRTGSSCGYSSYNKPVTSAAVYAGTVTKGRSYGVDLTLVNTSTKGTLNVHYDIS